MAVTLDDYRCKLVRKILSAQNQDEVKRFVEAGMRGLEQHNVNKHIAVRFADSMLLHLGELSPLNLEADQWRNIKLARIQFNQIKRSLLFPGISDFSKPNG